MPDSDKKRHTTIDIIQWYSRFGWHIFPVHSVRDGRCTCGQKNCSVGKHPLISDNLNQATTSYPQIRKWWTRWPWANVGVACGVKSGIWVLDVDFNHGGEDSLDELVRVFGEFNTTKAQTCSGGLHFIFKHPGERYRVKTRGGLKRTQNLEGNTVVSDLPGIDIRGDGGYFIVYPSVGLNGRYYWEDGCDPHRKRPVPAPERLLRLVLADDSQGHNGRLPGIPDGSEVVSPSHSTMARIGQWIVKLRKAKKGEKHQTRYDAGLEAGRLCAAKKIGAQQALDVLFNAARTNSTLTDKQIRKDLEDGFRAGLRFPWTDTPPSIEIPPPPDDSHAPPIKPDSDPPKKKDAVPSEFPRELGNLKTKPAICITGRQMSELIEETWGEINRWNHNPPKWFRRDIGVGPEIVCIQHNEKLGPYISALSKAQVFGKITKLCDWTRYDPRTENIVSARCPPKEISDDMFASPHRRLPYLSEIGATPVFDTDGSMLTLPGYHAKAGLWLKFSRGLKIPDIPEKPTPGDVAKSVSLLLGDLFVDFPFASQADRAHAFAALLLPFVRRMIDGCTPIHLVEAPTPGSGKGLLVASVANVVLGQDIAVSALPRQEDELRKRISTTLLDAYPISLLDNIGGHLDSPTLAAMLTSRYWSDRRLGHLESITVPNNTVWVMTANNPSMTWEVARRCCRIRIEPKQERPDQRTGYKHVLPKWALENRSEIVSACLTMIRHWIAEGKPPGDRVLGSFEAWSAVIGGILKSCNIDGFLGNTGEMYQTAARDNMNWADFVQRWWEKYNNFDTEVKQLVDLCLSEDLIPEVLGDKGLNSQRVRLARALGKMRGRVFDGKEIQQFRKAKVNANLYRLADVGGDDEDNS